MRRLVRFLLIPLALLFLLEAWLWHHLAPVVAWTVARIPLAAFKASLAAWLEGLPPPATLTVFIVPVMLLLPLKFIGLWMLANGFWLGAVGVLVLAKLLSVGVTAFIFEITRPKLLQMAWFRQVYVWVLWLLERAHALVDPVTRQLKLWLRLLSPRRAGRTTRLLLRLRRRMQAQAAP